jgi:DNA-binding beta-propeller fold protein YncE
VRDIKLLLLLATLAMGACADDPNGPSGPSGPIPAVLVDHEFGEGPVAGTLRVVPGPGTVGWRYFIDAIPPESQVREGTLEGVIAIPYRFDTPGVHRIRVELLGPEGSQVVEKPIVVVDPESDFEILAQRSIDEIWPEREHMAPEGIVMDPAGRWLYAAMYRSGELVRIDPETLEAVDRVVLGPQLEGLAVAPSGDRLFAIHKNAGLSVVDLTSFTTTHFDNFSGYYIVATDASHALFGGNSLLGRVNIDTREIDWAPLTGGAGHFSVFPDGDRFVSIMYPSFGVPDHSSLEILSLPSLDPIRSIPLEEFPGAQYVVVDPSGDAMYVVGREFSGVRFLALDPPTGDVITSMFVPGSGCGIFCVANPVVTFASGRYIAFELGGAVMVVDTALDLPRYRFDLGGMGYDYDEPSGVAAHPDSDILYVLGPLGRLFKVRLRNP